MSGATVREFALDLEAFGVEVEADALRLTRAASEVAAEGLVIGNQYGAGAPTDTGFLRSSFRVGIGRPAPGPTQPPKSESGRGTARMQPPAITLQIARATLDQPIYVTTNVPYAEWLEFLPRTRRFGPAAGQSTIFVRPIELRWESIVLDTMRRLGIGDAGASTT